MNKTNKKMKSSYTFSMLIKYQSYCVKFTKKQNILTENENEFVKKKIGSEKKTSKFPIAKIKSDNEILSTSFTK